MEKHLIFNTTKEQREKYVAEAIETGEVDIEDTDGFALRVMQLYIGGDMELRQAKRTARSKYRIYNSTLL